MKFPIFFSDMFLQLKYLSIFFMKFFKFVCSRILSNINMKYHIINKINL